MVTRNRKNHLERNAIPAGYSHTNARCVSGVNYYLNSHHKKYLAQVCDFLRFGKFPPQIIAIPVAVAPPTDGTMKRLMRCKGHLDF